MCTSAPLKPCKLGELFNFETLQMSGRTHFEYSLSCTRETPVGPLVVETWKFGCRTQVQQSQREKEVLTRPFWTFQHHKTCCILKKGNDSYGFDWSYLFSCPVFSVEGLGGGGLEKQEKACCGEVGTFKNIVACHHKMIDDTELTVSRLNND